MGPSERRPRVAPLARPRVNSAPSSRLKSCFYPSFRNARRNPKGEGAASSESIAPALKFHRDRGFPPLAGSTDCRESTLSTTAEIGKRF